MKRQKLSAIRFTLLGTMKCSTSDSQSPHSNTHLMLLLSLAAFLSPSQHVAAQTTARSASKLATPRPHSSGTTVFDSWGNTVILIMCIGYLIVKAKKNELRWNEGEEVDKTTCQVHLDSFSFWFK